MTRPLVLLSRMEDVVAVAVYTLKPNKMLFRGHTLFVSFVIDCPQDLPGSIFFLVFPFRGNSPCGQSINVVSRRGVALLQYLLAMKVRRRETGDNNEALKWLYQLWLGMFRYLRFLC